MTSSESAAAGVPARNEEIACFYRENARELWAIFYSMCSDPERAHDAVQEAFVRLYDHQGEPVRDLRAWLLRVGQNWLRDVARRKSSGCSLLPGLDEFTGGAVDPRQTAQLHERQQQVRVALAELNEDDRRVLVMKYSMDWSAAQMGTVMGCTAAAIDMRLSRARRRLAEILVERGYQHEQF